MRADHSDGNRSHNIDAILLRRVPEYHVLFGQDRGERTEL